MTIDHAEEYILGQDVTDIALSKGPKSIVVSVGLSIEELDHLEKLCAVSGKSFSQVILDAIAAYHAEPAAR